MERDYNSGFESHPTAKAVGFHRGIKEKVKKVVVSAFPDKGMGGLVNLQNKLS
jgi:hypothetical protein